MGALLLSSATSLACDAVCSWASLAIPPSQPARPNIPPALPPRCGSLTMCPVRVALSPQTALLPRAPGSSQGTWSVGTLSAMPPAFPAGCLRLSRTMALTRALWMLLLLATVEPMAHRSANSNESLDGRTWQSPDDARPWPHGYAQIV
ncbi:hypothetical protein B0J12DRAFT_649609 [Macrophomina phaseolina]|uniref:Uncharacterized protein n=1 Tax=Macrophomina phaseolina TaxID=35725 RepID=A0ABQ8GLU7_9PEZI|nr:hypothetical protein B0J12DRAFT_649609 [Macrophomina phaseolina]